MKALILNSGLGTRIGNFTKQYPKCMAEISNHETILSRQLKLLEKQGIRDVIITTGMLENKLIAYCNDLNLSLNLNFIYNPDYNHTNYIYSIYLARNYLDDDIIIMHGDIVFEKNVLIKIIESEKSCIVTSSTAKLPEKDFKAVIKEDSGNMVSKIGIEFFENAITAQPLYKLKKKDWAVWLKEICSYCERGITSCYAEVAFNEISNDCNIYSLDIKDLFCHEVDTMEDWRLVKEKLEKDREKIVYMCFSTDIIHSGHIAIIDKAAKLGRLIIGILSDEAIASYKRFPLLPFEERKNIISHISAVSEVIEQRQLSYVENIKTIKPDYIVHGDDWRTGFQVPIRNEVIQILSEYGGKLIEYPYTKNDIYEVLEQDQRRKLSIPDIRRGRLKKLLDMKQLVTAMEAHSGITGLIVEKTNILQDGKVYQFDAMWVSSLCDSTAKGKPDIELVDMTSRYRTIDDIIEVTTKPIIFDGDTGGLVEHFVYTVRTLERMGVSAIIIEDKTGLKKNSLFGTEVEQIQDSIENFCTKIRAGKHSQKTNDFMIIARIESLILEKGIEDALNRAIAYVEAGADGIMIHSRKKNPKEIFDFVDKFRNINTTTPIVVVPTSFNIITEEEFKNRGINIVIYANQLTRSSFPAMKKTAETILKNHRAKEAEEFCMSINEIITLIPEESI